MKTGWKVKPLGELCDILDSRRRPVTKSDRIVGPYPYYGATGIQDFVNDFIFDEPLVLVGEDGAKWLSGENTAFTIEGKCWVNNHAHVLRPIRENLLDNWLVYFLNHSDLTEFVSGLTVQKLNQGSLREICIPLAPIEEQRRIATLLDEAFADIAIATANAEKNLPNARELFESHLDSIVTNLQASVEIVPLSELATNITDGDHMPPPKVEQGLPFITIGNIDKQTRAIDFTDTFQVSREYFDGLKANKKPKRGDVLYTVTGSFGIPVLVEDDKEFCFQRHIGLVRPKADVDSIWLHYLLQSPQVFNQAADGATGTAQKTVSLKVLRNLQVPKISPKEQLAHVEILRSLETESRRLESIYRQKLTALDALKKSLLHQAFSGQL